MKKTQTILIILLDLLINFSLLNCNILDKFELVKVYDIDNTSFNINNIYFNNNTLYFFKPVSKDSIFLYDLSHGKNYKLNLPSKINFEGFITFLISNDTIFYNDWATFHAFRFSENTNIHLFSTNLSHYYSLMKKINDTVYVFDATTSSSCFLSKSFTNVEKIKLRKGTQSLTKLPDPSAIDFSLIAYNKMIDIYENKYFVANFNKYQVNIYDLKVNIIDSLVYNNPNWKYKIMDSFPSLNINKFHPSRHILKLKPYTMKNNILNKIDILDSGILVCWSEPTGEEYAGNPKFDYWKCINGEWKLLFENDSVYNDTAEKLRNASSIKFKYYSYKIIDNYLLVYVKGCSKDIYHHYLYKSEEEFKKALNDYFTSRELTSIVLIFRFKGM